MPGRLPPRPEERKESASAAPAAKVRKQSCRETLPASICSPIRRASASSPAITAAERPK